MVSDSEDACFVPWGIAATGAGGVATAELDAVPVAGVGLDCDCEGGVADCGKYFFSRG